MKCIPGMYHQRLPNSLNKHAISIQSQYSVYFDTNTFTNKRLILHAFGCWSVRIFHEHHDAASRRLTRDLTTRLSLVVAVQVQLHTHLIGQFIHFVTSWKE